MKAKELYTYVGIAVTLAIMVGMSTVAYTQTAVADKGGVPNDSARSGPACENVQEVHERFFDRDDGSSRGISQAHISTAHNDRGLESAIDQEPEC
jgi:hypothetical protein